MRPKHLKNILYIAAVICLLWLFQAEAEDPKTSTSTGAQPSRIEMTLAENGVQANGKLFFLPTYDASGNATGGIQNELLNSILDISNLPIGRDGWLPAIGIQVGDDGSIMHSVHLRRKKYMSALVDENGVVYPDCKKSSDDGGPYVCIVLMTDESHLVSLKSVKVEASSKSMSKYETAILASDILVVKKVTHMEPLTVIVMDKALGKKWETTLYPTYRGATAAALLYRVRNVEVGRTRTDAPIQD